MKHLLRAIALLAAMSLGSSAIAEDCVPLEPKKWEGVIKVGTGGWLTASAFKDAGCDFGGQDAVLNGFDGLVLDVTDYDGLPVVLTWTGEGNPLIAVSGEFINEDCEGQSNTPAIDEGVPTTVVIPENAKWLSLIGGHGGANIKITVESGGVVCEDEDEPKKKKKKKRRRR